jgi:hypothetical protein
LRTTTALTHTRGVHPREGYSDSDQSAVVVLTKETMNLPHFGLGLTETIIIRMPHSFLFVALTNAVLSFLPASTVKRELSAAALALLLAPGIASAGSAEIEHVCTVRYPNVWRYFAWKDCVKTATQQEEQDNLKRMREEQARSCIGADVSRMEGLATKARDAVKSESSLEDVKEALTPILGYAEIQVAHDDIKDRVLGYSIHTKCDSLFRLSINIRVGPDHKLRRFSVLAEDPPAGDKEDYHEELSVDFDQQRREELHLLESAKRELQAKMAKLEQERKEQHQKTLDSIIVIRDVKPRCFDNFCYLEAVITNGSERVISEISFGWILRPPQMTACPTELGQKKSVPVFMHPGETLRITIIPDAEEISHARYCLRVTGLSGIPKEPYDD